MIEIRSRLNGPTIGEDGGGESLFSISWLIDRATAGAEGAFSNPNVEM
jgi:hypothetical protein